ncbi:MAG: hypothetical protein LBD45_02720 [Bacteroidales bacterium]|jgi:hypothetical protein|nr:hypothetical protein [Bacteroidales bacterium]
MKKIFSFVFFITLGCFTFQTWADDVYYVSPTGSDTSNGSSPSAAFKTLAKAIASVTLGASATIYLEEGGEFNSPATVIIGEGRDVTIVGKNTTVKSGVNPYFGQRILQFSTGTNAKISGITFRNGCTRGGIPGGAIFFEGDKLEIDSCSFIENEGNNSGAAIACRGKELTITNSVFHQNRAYSGYGYGGVLWFSGPYPATTDNAGSLIIRNCAFTENQSHTDTHGEVISLGHAYRASEDKTGPAGGIANGFTNVKYFELTNCLFKGNINAGASSTLTGGEKAAEVSLFKHYYALEANIINNTFYNSKALMVGDFIRFDGILRMVNNVFYNKDNYTIYFQSGTDARDPFIAWNNAVVGEMVNVDDVQFYSERTQYGNQLFVGSDIAKLKMAMYTENAGSYVTYLPITDASSPLIDKGLSSTAGKEGFDKEYIPATDIRGVAVSGVKDIGSFEFPSSSGLAGIAANSLYSLASNGEVATVKNLTGKPLNLKIYLVDGRCIYRASVAEEVNIHRSELEVPGGILIVEVNNDQVNDSKKVILF